MNTHLYVDVALEGNSEGPMTKDRVRQRTVYLVTAGLVACMIAGFAMAQFSTGGVNKAQQGSQTTTVEPIAGLSFISTNLTELSNSPTATCTSGASPCDLSSGSYASCVGGFSSALTCGVTDFVEQINLTTTLTALPANANVELTVFVTGTPTGMSSPVTVACPGTYYAEPTGLPSSPSVITLDFDIGSVASGGPGAVSSVTVIGNVL